MMALVYCFSNASLTQRVLSYLTKKLRQQVEYVTVIFFNDCWIVRLKLKENMQKDYFEDCQAVLAENGISCQVSNWINPVFKELDSGCNPTAVMNHHNVSIVSHGKLQLEEVEHFRQQFVKGLGYCPPSLI